MTNLVPANIKQSLEHFRDRLSRTLNRWMPHWRRDNGHLTPVDTYDLSAGIWDRFGPALDVEEDDNEIRVTAELPGLDPDDFKGYLQAHMYGLPPHGGLAIGLERMAARILGVENIRLTTMFPRDAKRLTP